VVPVKDARIIELTWLTPPQKVTLVNFCVLLVSFLFYFFLFSLGIFFISFFFLMIADFIADICAV